MKIPKLPRKAARYLLEVAMEPGITVQQVQGCACRHEHKHKGDYMPGGFKITDVCPDISCTNCIIGRAEVDKGTLLLVLKALAHKDTS